MEHIYLDHAASTPVHPDVAAEMVKVMTGHVGNASSIHAYGRDVKKLIQNARDRIAKVVDCLPEELVFTSGGTESDNLALFGVATAFAHQGKHIITTQAEHHAILHACEQLEAKGYEVTYLPVDDYGRVTPTGVLEAIREDTILISIMYANNETGTIQPIEEIGKIAKENHVLFHVDAVQAMGILPISCSQLPVDLMSFSSHKMNGPQGIGALYVRQKLQLTPLLFGGLQEKKRRAGTENVAGIVGFATAADIAYLDQGERYQHYEELRALFLAELDERVGHERYIINGHPEHRLPHIINISFPECGTETMLMNLDMEGIAVASGSACTSGSLEPSHVLKAMNLSEETLSSAIRFSMGMGNTIDNIKFTAQKIGTILERLRNKK
jgi:cysteine desulfurase